MRRGDFFLYGWENLPRVASVARSNAPTTKTMEATQKLINLEGHFRSMEHSDTRMDCLCLIAAGKDNANDTLGWQQTEENAALTIRSIESLLSDASKEVQSAFKSVGITF